MAVARHAEVVLSRLQLNLSQAGRLIESEYYEDALELIQITIQNLNTIRPIISNESFTNISQLLIQLQIFCNHQVVNTGIRNKDCIAYRANRSSVGKVGRPTIQTTLEQLMFFLSEDFKAVSISKMIGCSKSSVYNMFRRRGIRIREKYSVIDDNSLIQIICNIHKRFRNSGSKMMIGYLKAEGYIIQRERVRSLLKLIDPIGTASRWCKAIKRRTYKVPTPNALWHMDAHLKLIRWGFVTHGCIDGYSRLITYIKCACSINANIVLGFFVNSIAQYGLPSRVRSDHGYENIYVAFVMNAIRGINRNSHITGKSVHNQRIERLWVDVFKQVIDVFYEEFTNLERNGNLNPENNIHRFALQNVYLPEINRSLSEFMEAWNRHPIRTEKNMSPRKIWIKGMLNNYESDYTGPKEVFYVQEDIVTRIRQGLFLQNTNFDVVQVPENTSPLTASLELNNIQTILVDTMKAQNIEPKIKYLA